MCLVLQRLLGVDAPANKVQEVKTETLESLQILHRDDCMVMYAPAFADKKPIYEIIVHRPYSESMNTSYRLVMAYRLLVKIFSSSNFRLKCFYQFLIIFSELINLLNYTLCLHELSVLGVYFIKNLKFRKMIIEK